MKQTNASRQYTSLFKAGRLRKFIADRLLALASRLHRYPVGRTAPSIDELVAIPGFTRLEWTSFEKGKVKLSFTALDPVWGSAPSLSQLIGLHDHVVRLCFTIDEVAQRSNRSSWSAVAANLHLAASLEDLFAETDIDHTSFWCSPAAAYERTNREVAEKHLAGILIFNLVWTAYECAIEAVHGGSGNAGKGARGREWFLSRFGDKPFPLLCECVLNAVESTHHPIDFGRADMRRAIAAGAWAAIGAEHLRQFRNAVTHGDLPKPEPEGWGERSEYRVDDDPAIRQFSPNIRLTLILIQILALSEVADGDELSGWRSEIEPAFALLEQLHAVGRLEEQIEQMELELPGAHRIADDEW